MRKWLKKYRKILRIFIDLNNKKRLKNSNFTIISQNCVAGVIYHDLGLPFLSPTINLSMRSCDFVKLCRNLRRYMEIKPVPLNDSEDRYPFPLAKLDDIVLYLVHYDTFESFLLKWEERKKRINYENLYFIMVENDGCSLGDMIEFNRLENEHRVILVSKKKLGIDNAVFIEPNYKTTSEFHKMGDIVAYKSIVSGSRYLDKFDYVSFLNER